MRRVFVLLLSLPLWSCTTHEAKLEAAKATLTDQIIERQVLLGDNKALDEYETRLDEWHDGLQAKIRARRPLVPIPLEPAFLAPALLPELPPRAPLESARSSQLRAEIAALTEQLRSLDREVSALEQRKERIKARDQEASVLDDFVNEPAPNLNFFDPALMLPPPDAGTMRHIPQ